MAQPRASRSNGREVWCKAAVNIPRVSKIAVARLKFEMKPHLGRIIFVMRLTVLKAKKFLTTSIRINAPSPNLLDIFQD